LRTKAKNKDIKQEEQEEQESDGKESFSQTPTQISRAHITNRPLQGRIQ
jgi:hypothetical protein